MLLSGTASFADDVSHGDPGRFYSPQRIRHFVAALRSAAFPRCSYAAGAAVVAEMPRICLAEVKSVFISALHPHSSGQEIRYHRRAALRCGGSLINAKQIDLTTSIPVVGGRRADGFCQRLNMMSRLHH